MDNSPNTADINNADKSKQIELVLESSIDGVVIANSKGEITYLNKSALDMFGLTKDEMLGKPLADIMPEKYRSLHQQGMERFISTKIPKVIGKVVELEGLKKDGTVFPIEMSLSSVDLGNDEITFTAIIRDISSRKKAETDLKEKMTQLEDMNKIMVDRELKMVEFKNQIVELEKKLAQK
jgi:PAS domain S-box-containing protein